MALVAEEGRLMRGDPSRRPSNERVRMPGHVTDKVWVECNYCLGDGWHYPQVGVMLDRLPPTRKLTCRTCDGLGARMVTVLEVGAAERVVPAPRHMARGR